MRARASGPRGTSGSDETRSCTECLPAGAASKAENCALVEASAASGMLLTRPTNMAPSHRVDDTGARRGWEGAVGASISTDMGFANRQTDLAHFLLHQSLNNRSSLSD